MSDQNQAYASDISGGGGEKDLKKYKGPEGTVLRYLKELELIKESKGQRAFETIGEKIVKTFANRSALQIYTQNAPSLTRVMYNVLWSNVQVLGPTLFCRLPKVACQRRFKDNDPIGRLACEMIQRTVSYSMMDQQWRAFYAGKSAVQDLLLPGRGTVWIRYDQGETTPLLDEAGNPVLDDDTNEPIQVSKPGAERVVIDPLMWLDYLETPSRNPYEVRIKFRRHYLTRAELIQKFGKEIGKAVTLNYIPGGNKKKKISADEEEFFAQAEVWEAWDNESKEIIWFSEGYKKGPLSQKPDVLHLKGFFSCPVPLLATTTSDSNYPTPDYKIYEGLADEVDYVTKRLQAMAECVRLVGAVAKQYAKDVKNMLDLKDGELWPVDAFAQLTEKGGLAGVINWLPFDQCVAAIPVLSQYRDDCLMKLDNIIGIPDIVRGSTDPNETLGAQQRKSHWTQVKIQTRQADVQRFWCEIVNIVAEIIFEPGLFSDETISQMCLYQQMSPEDQANYPAALQLLRDDRLRTFRIDIETDSTIAVDESDERGAMMEYLSAVKDIVGEVQGVTQFRPELLAPMVESAKGALRMFRNGSAMEGSWDKALDQIEQNDAIAAQQPPPPNVEMIKAQNEQAKTQLEGQKGQLEGARFQMEQQKEQFEQNLEMQKFQLETYVAQSDQQIKQQDLQIKGLSVQSKAQFDQMVIQLNEFKEKFAAATQAQVTEMQKTKMLLDEKNNNIEQVRADKAQTLETMRLAHEHVMALKDQQIEAMKAQTADKQVDNQHKVASKQIEVQSKAAKAQDQQAKKVETPKVPSVHVHLSGNVPGGADQLPTAASIIGKEKK